MLETASHTVSDTVSTTTSNTASNTASDTTLHAALHISALDISERKIIHCAAVIKRLCSLLRLAAGGAPYLAATLPVGVAGRVGNSSSSVTLTSGV